MRPLDLLYVDDEPDIRTIAVLALALDPMIRVTDAGDAQAALALVDARDTVADALVLDVMMPGISGPELSAAIRTRPGWADVPTIYMTARARVRDVEEYLAAGAAGVLVKPFDPVTLAADIRDILSRHSPR